MQQLIRLRQFQYPKLQFKLLLRFKINKLLLMSLHPMMLLRVRVVVLYQLLHQHPRELVSFHRCHHFNLSFHGAFSATDKVDNTFPNVTIASQCHVL